MLVSVSMQCLCLGIGQCEDTITAITYSQIHFALDFALKETPTVLFLPPAHVVCGKVMFSVVYVWGGFQVTTTTKLHYGIVHIGPPRPMTRTLGTPYIPDGYVQTCSLRDPHVLASGGLHLRPHASCSCPLIISGLVIPYLC